MKIQSEHDNGIGGLCSVIRELLPKRQYRECEKHLCDAMQQFPHAPHPHNLYGLLFQAQGEHRSAMNHFRAALALDATYKPAQHNLNHFGTFYSRGKMAYDESDCPEDPNRGKFDVVRDKHGVCRLVRKK